MLVTSDGGAQLDGEAGASPPASAAPTATTAPTTRWHATTTGPSAPRTSSSTTRPIRTSTPSPATGDGALVIVGERGALLRSSDNGASWQRLRLPYEGSMFGVLAPAG